MKRTTDRLVPDAEMRDQLGISSKMTVWRWRRDGILPPAVVIAGRNYTHQSVIDRLKEHGDGSTVSRPPEGSTA